MGVGLPVQSARGVEAIRRPSIVFAQGCGSLADAFQSRPIDHVGRFILGQWRPGGQVIKSDGRSARCVHWITHFEIPSPSVDDDRLTEAGGGVVSLPCWELGLRASSITG